MQGLGSFLLFAGFFYFMMRYGCGAHLIHGHGGHEAHRDPADRVPKASDPGAGGAR